MPIFGVGSTGAYLVVAKAFGVLAGAPIDEGTISIKAAVAVFVAGFAGAGWLEWRFRKSEKKLKLYVGEAMGQLPCKSKDSKKSHYPVCAKSEPAEQQDK